MPLGTSSETLSLRAGIGSWFPILDRHKLGEKTKFLHSLFFFFC